jgi:hypothetical protein
MISGITDVVVEVEGFTQVPRGAFVLVDEVPDGGLGTLRDFAVQLGDGAAAG